MKLAYIYFIVGKPDTEASGFVYVGYTNNLKRRWKEHRHNFKTQKKQVNLSRKINELGGVDNFNFIKIADILYPTIDFLLAQENHYMDIACHLFGDNKLLNESRNKI